MIPVYVEDIIVGHLSDGLFDGFDSGVTKVETFADGLPPEEWGLRLRIALFIERDENGEIVAVKCPTESKNVVHNVGSFVGLGD